MSNNQNQGQMTQQAQGQMTQGQMTQGPVPISTNDENWLYVQQNTTINNYPRPQGSLPMFNWALKATEQAKLSKLWADVGQNQG